MYKKYFRFITLCVILLQFPFEVFSATPFKFAILTDLHISVLKPQNALDLENAVADINLERNIDFVLISGDDTDLGDLESFKEAKKILDKLLIPYYISTGNHDTNYGETGSVNFNSVFGNDRFSFVKENFQFLGFPTSPLNRKSKAHISIEELKFIKHELRKSNKKNPVFLMTHYPMLSGDLDNFNDLNKILKRRNIVSILSGHYHRNVLLNYDGIPGIVNRSTLRANEKVGGYTILSVSDSLRVFEKKIGQSEDKWLTLAIRKK